MSASRSPLTTPPTPPTPPDRLEDDEPEQEHGSPLMRFGAAVGAALASATLAVLPAAVRVSPVASPLAGTATVLTALVALALVPVGLTTLAVRYALAAVRLFDARGLGQGLATAVLWAVATFGALAGLGAFLRATTHHHGLAGVTFAVAGALGIFLLAPFCIRAVELTLGAPPELRWTIIVAAGLAFGVSVAFSLRALGADGGAAALAVDLIAFAFACAFGGGAFPVRSRPITLFALGGPPLAAVALVVGLGTLRTSPPLRSALESGAPLVGLVLSAAPLDRPDAPH